MTHETPKVFVAVPVFERLDATLACIEGLRRQTYPKVEIVIIDGGSRDGSAEQLAMVEGITFIGGVGEQWWAGATWFGIDHALRCGGDADFVLLLNDDTQVPSDLIDVLVSESARLDAVIGPIVRTHESRVVNSGVWVDWSDYTLTQRAGDPAPAGTTWAVDALEGRGTLVPIRMIRLAGNVARQQLPHYAADYEFSMRLARHGASLMMTNRTSVTIHWEPERLGRYWERASWRRLWWEATDQRSFMNIRTHLMLIDRCAPKRGRWKAKAHFVIRRAGDALRRGPLRELPGVEPAVKLARRWLPAPR